MTSLVRGKAVGRSQLPACVWAHHVLSCARGRGGRVVNTPDRPSVCFRNMKHICHHNLQGIFVSQTGLCPPPACPRGCDHALADASLSVLVPAGSLCAIVRGEGPLCCPLGPRPGTSRGAASPVSAAPSWSASWRCTSALRWLRPWGQEQEWMWWRVSATKHTAQGAQSPWSVLILPVPPDLTGPPATRHSQRVPWAWPVPAPGAAAPDTWQGLGGHGDFTLWQQ